MPDIVTRSVDGGKRIQGDYVLDAAVRHDLDAIYMARRGVRFRQSIAHFQAELAQGDPPDLDHETIEKQKQLRRDLWDYRTVDHVPVVIWLAPSCGYTLREQLEDGEVQFRVNVETIRKSLRLIPDDYIPFARVNRANDYRHYVRHGAVLSDDPNQPPGTGAASWTTWSRSTA
jgi:hypothetical protein